jgi:sugar phosphate permease
MAIHQTALYTGIVASGFIAGFVGEHFGWRMSFFSFGLVGLLWAVVIWFRLKDTKQEEPQGQETEKVSIREVLKSIAKTKTVYMLSLAFGGMVFVNVGYVTWMPTLLHEKFDLSLSNAGFSSMFYHHLLAYAGVLLGGKISDYFAQKRYQVRMEVEYLGLLLGAPFIYFMGRSESLVITYAMLAGFGFFRGIYDSNLFAALFDVIPQRIRSSSVGLMLSFAFIVGAFAPVILGWVKQNWGLSVGMASMGFVYVLGAIFIFIGLKLFFKRDYVEEL